MRTSFSKKHQRKMIEIFPGEYYATKNKDVILTTLLGSCVSVCLHDPVNKISGLNHIMISTKTRFSERNLTADTRYGIHAMEMLINQMIKYGADRRYMKAKVFGGGKVLNQGDNSIAYNNINFAIDYLKEEKFEILSQDTGGKHGRKIFFLSNNFKIYLRRIHIRSMLDQTYRKEEEAIKKIKDREKEESNLTFFD